MDIVEKVLGLLAEALGNPLSRKETIDDFLQSYLENELIIKRSIGREAFDILGELVADLNFFVADPNWIEKL